MRVWLRNCSPKHRERGKLKKFLEMKDNCTQPKTEYERRHDVTLEYTQKDRNKIAERMKNNRENYHDNISEHIHTYKLIDCEKMLGPFRHTMARR